MGKIYVLNVGCSGPQCNGEFALSKLCSAKISESKLLDTLVNMLIWYQKIWSYSPEFDSEIIFLLAVNGTICKSAWALKKL